MTKNSIPAGATSYSKSTPAKQSEIKANVIIPLGQATITGLAAYSLLGSLSAFMAPEFTQFVLPASLAAGLWQWQKGVNSANNAMIIKEEISTTAHYSLGDALILIWNNRPTTPTGSAPVPSPSPRPVGSSNIDQLVKLPSVTALLQNEWAVLVFGAKGTGKTTLLKALVNSRPGDVVIVDPHNEPGKWGENRVYGAGRDFIEAEKIILGIGSELDKRYKQMATGEVKEGDFYPLWLIIDEGMSIVNNTSKSTVKAICSLLTEGRKVAMGILLANHSTMVKALGIEGKSDLREGLSIVHLTLTNGQRKQYLKQGELNFIPVSFDPVPPAGNVPRPPENTVLKDVLIQPKDTFFNEYSLTQYSQLVRVKAEIEAAGGRVTTSAMVNKIGGNRNNTWKMVKLFLGEKLDADN